MISDSHDPMSPDDRQIAALKEKVTQQQLELNYWKNFALSLVDGIHRDAKFLLEGGEIDKQHLANTLNIVCYGLNEDDAAYWQHRTTDKAIKVTLSRCINTVKELRGK